MSGDNERTCTNCGYTERIDFFLPVKVFLGGILLGIFIAFLLVQLNIEKVAAFVLPVVVLTTIVLLIKAIIQKDSIGKAVKRLILTLVYGECSSELFSSITVLATKAINSSGVGFSPAQGIVRHIVWIAGSGIAIAASMAIMISLLTSSTVVLFASATFRKASVELTFLCFMVILLYNANGNRSYRTIIA